MTQTDPADLKQRLLEAALTHIPFEGMNDRAIDAAARDLGLAPAQARIWFPQGGASLAAAIHRAGDARLREWLAHAPPGRIRDRITEAVWQRLQFADPELVRAASAVLALPQNAALGARLIWETADTIWTGLGDASRDVNWYSKRATLSGVYSATALYWLGDSSPGHADTREFLDRRIDGVMGFEKLKAQARKWPGVSALTTLATGWIRAPHHAGAAGTSEKGGAGAVTGGPEGPFHPWEKGHGGAQVAEGESTKPATGPEEPFHPWEEPGQGETKHKVIKPATGPEGPFHPWEEEQGQGGPSRGGDSARPEEPFHPWEQAGQDGAQGATRREAAKPATGPEGPFHPWEEQELDGAGDSKGDAAKPTTDEPFHPWEKAQ